MKTFIYIDEKWPELDDFGSVKWANADKPGVIVHRGIAKEPEGIPKSKEYEVIAPSNVVYLTSVEAPKKNVGVFLKSIPNAVEEKIACNFNDIHVAAGEIQPDRVVPIAVVNKGWITKALNKLSSDGITPSSMRIETLEAPINDCYTAVLNATGGFVRTGKYSGFNMDFAPDNTIPLSLKLAIETARSNGSTLDHIDIYQSNSGDPPNIDLWPDELGMTVSQKGEWDVMRNLHRQGESINLLQGEFASQSRLIEHLPRFKSAAVMAILALLITLLGAWTEYRQLSNEKQHLKDEMTQIYKSAFPESVNIFDCQGRSNNVPAWRRKSVPPGLKI